MVEEKATVPLEEAIEQVALAMSRVALLHLAFSKTLVEKLGEEEGKKIILQSIIEYGRRIGERSKRDIQDLPFYGVHDPYVYENETYRDTRHKPRSKEWNSSLYKVYGCVLAKIFKESSEEDLGCLYCYVDPAKSIAVDPHRKVIHTKCEPCGDDYCAFNIVDTTDKEKKDFLNKDIEWKDVDPILIKGSNLSDLPKKRKRKCPH